MKKIKEKCHEDKETKTYKPTLKINNVNQEQEYPAPRETIVVEIQSKSPHPQSQQSTILPTGEIAVVNTTTE
ncbi:unnamed protein product [Angiostrongylus costaricensis]|uniref:Uncharacterized protein n=1 Tax=Angiostrongylus costaricensis TaxID=334426 RepID=A0A0R3PMH8_ANGCS|nr:unnamed protein product [Angiostrongylus costaricensis]